MPKNTQIIKSKEESWTFVEAEKKGSECEVVNNPFGETKGEGDGVYVHGLSCVSALCALCCV